MSDSEWTLNDVLDNAKREDFAEVIANFMLAHRLWRELTVETDNNDE